MEQIWRKTKKEFGKENIRIVSKREMQGIFWSEGRNLLERGENCTQKVFQVRNDIQKKREGMR